MVYRNVCCCNYDIIIISETWLNSSVQSSELFDDRYVVYRRDRENSSLQSGKEGGGVLIAVTKRINSKRAMQFESNCEDLWVILDLDLSVAGPVRRMALCAVYLPPPVRTSYLEHFLDNCNSTLEQLNDSYVCITGDFNLGNIDWKITGNSNDNFKLPSNSEALLDFTYVNKLTQFNNINNASGRILDLVLCSHSLCQVNQCIDAICNIDQHHPPLDIVISLNKESKLPYNTVESGRPNFRKTNYIPIRKYLSELNWEELFEGQHDVDEMVQVFYDNINTAIQKFISTRVPRNRKYPPWFNRNLIKMLNLKNKIRKRYNTYKNPMDKIELKIISKRCDDFATVCYNNYLKKLEDDLTMNPKLFWTYVKSKRGGSSTYPASMTDGIRTSSDGTEICEFFASYFSSVYSPVQGDYNLQTANNLSNLQNYSSCLTNPTIDHETIYKKLKNLDCSKGAGPDGIPPIFICECAAELVAPLSFIFNKSLASGIFPSKWKEAKVVPIHKSDDDDVVSNYRPISILSTLAKVFESLICPHIQNHLKLYLSEAQHGFVESRSTGTNLVLFTELLVEAIDSGYQANVIYTDFSKAFDKVSHNILIKKLQAYGITGPLLSWLSSYLVDRSFFVVVNGFQSTLRYISSGVPQGSHLGPVLFNYFINDIPYCFLHSNIFMYADDIKFVKIVKNKDDAYELQSDLDRLVQWCDNNAMHLNARKCYHVKFSRKHTLVEHSYYIKGDKVGELDTIRDLGVTFDRKLTFIPHVDSIIKKSSKMLGFVLRNTKQFRSCKTKIMLYNCLVRSVLEYCSVVWRPHYAAHSLRLERVQKRFLWHLAFSRGIAKKVRSYNNRLRHFKMISLDKRRRLNDATFVCKVMAHKIDCPQILSTFNFRAPSRVPRSQITPLRPPQRRTVLGSNSPYARFCKVVNGCSDVIDLHFNSLSQLRTNIYKYHFDLD